jgi:hypothetical protein
MLHNLEAGGYVWLVFKIITVVVLYHCELYILPALIEEQKYVMTSSGMLLIEYLCHQFFFSLVCDFCSLALIL